MRAIWAQEKPSYQGRYVTFAGVQAQPQPVQQPTPPIIIGGRTPEAFRRAVEHGHGWYGFGMDVEQTARISRRCGRRSIATIVRPTSASWKSALPHPAMTWTWRP